MNKRLFIVHGWDGYPEEGWFPWLKAEAEKAGFAVTVPQLPDPALPRIEKWVPTLASAVAATGAADSETYFVGHSMGCQTIARFLQTLPEGQQIGGAVFVAGFFKHLKGLEDDPNVMATDRHWLETPPDLAKVKSHVPKCIAIFSDNDPFVPLDNQDDFREKLGAEVIVQHDKGHFSGNLNKAFELPSAYEALIKISQ